MWHLITPLSVSCTLILDFDGWHHPSAGIHYKYVCLFVEPWKRVCYLTNKAADRSGLAKFTPKLLDASLCTHVILGYADIRENILKQTGEQDDGLLHPRLHCYNICYYIRIVRLREYNKSWSLLPFQYTFTYTFSYT